MDLLLEVSSTALSDTILLFYCGCATSAMGHSGLMRCNMAGHVTDPGLEAGIASDIAAGVLRRTSRLKSWQAVACFISVHDNAWSAIKLLYGSNETS